MVLKVRDRLTIPPLCHIYAKSANGLSVTQDRDFAITIARIIGDYESIDSVRSGKFIPGIFRVNPVTIKHGTASCTPGVLHYKSRYNSCGAEQKVTGPYMAFSGSLPFGSVNNNLVQQALAKAYAKTKDAEFNAVVAMGELKETLELLRNPMRSLVKALSRAPGPYPGHRRLIDGMSGSWLTWWYGIKPLISDLDSAIKYITKIPQKPGLGLRRVRATVNNESSVSTSTATGVQSFSFTADHVTTTRHKVTAVVYYTVNINGVKPFEGPRALGMALDQLPANLWELVPFSFVVDWLYGVGAWLSNMTPSTQVQYVGNSVSSKISVTLRVSPGNPKYCTPPMDLTEFSPSIFTAKTDTLVRVVNQPVPALPVFHGALSLKNTITSLALICANMPKSWRRR